MEDLCEALSVNQTQLHDIIDTIYPFSQAEEALQFIWEGRQVGKVVLSL